MKRFIEYIQDIYYSLINYLYDIRDFVKNWNENSYVRPALQEKVTCIFCNKTRQEVENGYLHCGEPAPEEYPAYFMTYKFCEPICLECFINIKYNKKLIFQILTSNNDKHFGAWDYQSLVDQKSGIYHQISYLRSQQMIGEEKCKTQK
jgi:hypothetical protein